MNLVAKEYIAAQDPADPGVLVLSRFAGAAQQMGEALIVNPFDTHEVAEAIRTALAMPKSERIRRFERLYATIDATNIGWWTKRYLDALAGADMTQPLIAPPKPASAAGKRKSAKSTSPKSTGGKPTAGKPRRRKPPAGNATTASAPPAGMPTPS
jgi:trehalose 6-phosphate synthase